MFLKVKCWITMAAISRGSMVKGSFRLSIMRSWSFLCRSSIICTVSVGDHRSWDKGANLSTWMLAREDFQAISIDLQGLFRLSLQQKDLGTAQITLEMVRMVVGNERITTYSLILLGIFNHMFCISARLVILF